MVTPPFSDPLSSLRLADTFYTWFRRTNDIVTKLNPLQVYGITSGTGGIEVTIDGEGIATISSSLPYIVEGDHDFIGGITFSGTPINFHNPGSEHQYINFIGPSTITFGTGTGVFFENQVTFSENSTVNFEAMVDFHNTVTFHAEAIFKDDVTIGEDSTDRFQVLSGTSFENHVVFTDTVTHHPHTDASKNFQHIDDIVTFAGSDVSFDGNSTVDCYADATFHNEATFHDDVNMDDTSTLHLQGTIKDRYDSLGLENNVLTSDGTGKVAWTAQSGGGGGDGNGEIASKIVSKDPINWHTKSAQQFMEYKPGDSNPNSTSENIGDCGEVDDCNTGFTTRNVFSDFGIPEDATHIIIGGQMTIGTGGMESLEYNTGIDNLTQSTSRTIVRISAAGTSDNTGVNAEVIVPIGSDGNATIWINGDIEGNPSNYVRHAWVAGYVIPASTAASDSSQFLIDNQYFNSDSTDPIDSDTPYDNNATPTTDFLSVLGTLIATGGDVINDYAGGIVHTALNLDGAEFRGSNAMLSISGSIEFDPKRRHKWEFWVSPTAVETSPPLFNGKTWSKIVTTTPESSMQLESNADRYNSFSIDIPVIDIPMSGPMYLHSRVICTLNHGLAGQHLQNKCWGASYTWYGGGIGSVVDNIAQDIVILPGDERLSFSDGQPQHDTTYPGTNIGGGTVTKNVRTDFGFPVDTTHINVTALMRDDDTNNCHCESFAGLDTSAPKTTISRIYQSNSNENNETTTMWVPVGSSGNITIRGTSSPNELRIGVNGYMVNAGERSSAVADRTVTLDKMWNLATQADIPEAWVGGLTFGGLHRVSDLTDNFTDQIKPLFGAWYDNNVDADIIGWFNPHPAYDAGSPTNVHGFGGTGSDDGDSNLFRIEVNVHDDLGLDRSSHTITHVNLLSYMDDTLAIYHSVPTMMCPGKWNAGNRAKSKIVNEVTGQNANEAIAGDVDIGENMSRGSFPVDENGDFTVWYPDIGAHENQAHMRAWVVVEGYVEEARVAGGGSSTTSHGNVLGHLMGSQAEDDHHCYLSFLFCLTPAGPYLLGSWDVGHVYGNNPDQQNGTFAGGDINWWPYNDASYLQPAGVSHWSDSDINLFSKIHHNIVSTSSGFPNPPNGTGWPNIQILKTSTYPTGIDTYSATANDTDSDNMFAFLRPNTMGFHGTWEVIAESPAPAGTHNDGSDHAESCTINKHIEAGKYVFLKMGIYNTGNNGGNNWHDSYLNTYNWSSTQ